MKINPKTLARAQAIADQIAANVEAYTAKRIDYAAFSRRQSELHDSALSPTQKARKARGERAVCIVGDRNPTGDALSSILLGRLKCG